MKLILPISFIAIAGILFFMFIKPIYIETEQLKTDVSSYNEALNTSTDLQKIRDSLVDTYKNITKDNKDRLEHFLPSRINNIELILEIEKMASLYGMPIKDIKFETKKLEAKGQTNTDDIVVTGDPQDSLPYGIFPIEFVIQGRYDSFLSFLSELEHNLRLVDVKSISFKLPPESTDSTKTINPDIYDYTLTVETYWLK